MFLEKWKKGKSQPQKVPMGILEKNETTAMHKITFRASNNVNGKVNILSIAMTTGGTFLSEILILKLPI